MNDISKTPGIIDLFIEAKWLLYCIHCDDVPEWKKSYSSLSRTPFGFLDLKYEQIKKYDETVEIFCRFYYHDRLACTEKTIENASQITEGVAFNKLTRKHIYFIRNNSSFTAPEETSRFNNVLQPEVISFINNNGARMNEWFYNEAKKRGVV